MGTERKIVHVDMDAFYSSIEQRDDPELRGRPVIVGGDPAGRGVVATASYEARALGVHSAQSCKTAVRLCPNAVFLRPRFDIYRAVSAQIFAIYQRYTSLVEPLALDEAYLDLTETSQACGVSATRLAEQIKQEILREAGLTASAGISYCKFIAKLASAFQKPNGLTVVKPKQAEGFLERLPVGKFFGVGEVTEGKLKELGIQTGKDLKAVSLEQLHAVFGKRGTMLYAFVRGQDDRPVTPDRARKSVGKETTLEEDITDVSQMLDILEDLVEQVAGRLEVLGLCGMCITLKVRWSDFEEGTRSRTISTPFQGAQSMMECVSCLLLPLMKNGKAVRLLGVSISHLEERGKLVMRSLWEHAEGE